MQTAFIINPQSGSGRAKKQWQKIQPSINKYFPKHRTYFTKHSNHAIELAKVAIQENIKTIISVGGDGTHNEVVNGIMQTSCDDVVLGTLPMGTGGDLVKSLKIPAQPVKAIEQLYKRRVTNMDVGHIAYTDFNDKPQERYFLNVFSFGIGGLTDNLVVKSPKIFGGKVAFFIGVVRAIIQFRPQQVKLKLNDQEFSTDRLLNIAIANGKYFGGGLMISPESLLNDGLFDIVVIEDGGKLSSLISFPKIYFGTHLSDKRVTTYKTSNIVATTDQKVLLDVDGEPLGKLPCEVDCVRNRLSIIVGENY